MFLLFLVPAFPAAPPSSRPPSPGLLQELCGFLKACPFHLPCSELVEWSSESVSMIRSLSISKPCMAPRSCRKINAKHQCPTESSVLGLSATFSASSTQFCVFLITSCHHHLQFSLFKCIDHTLDFSFPNVLIHKVIRVHLDASRAGRPYQALPQMTAFFFSFLILSSCKTFLSYETQTLFHNFYLLPTLYLLSGVPWNTFCPRTPF